MNTKSPVRATSAAVIVALCCAGTVSAATLETCNTPKQPAQLTACKVELEQGTSLAIYRQWVSTTGTKQAMPVQSALVAFDAKHAVVGASYGEGEHEHNPWRQRLAHLTLQYGTR
jgi:hypothetical protein